MTSLDDYRIKSLVKKYSDYIRYPIKMDLEKHRPKKTAKANMKAILKPKPSTAWCPSGVKTKAN